MRRSPTLVVTLAAVLVWASAGSLAAAVPKPPKAGAKCPKVGLVQESEGVVFKCVKKGKKRIWKPVKGSGGDTGKRCRTWSEKIFTTTTPDFDIVTPRQDEMAADIEKVVEVFGIRLMALKGVTDRDLVLSATVLAQWLDNDEDGQPDNKKVQSELQRQHSRMILGVGFDRSIGPWHDKKQRLLRYESAPTYGLDVTTINHARYGLEPSGYSDDWMIEEPLMAPDAATEETLHLVTDVGFGGVYPADFWSAIPGIPEYASGIYRCYLTQQGQEKLKGASRLTRAMDTARGGFFSEIPEQYPAGAWYTRYDECEYGCLAAEYVHWAAITLAGMMQGRVTGIPRDRDGQGDEWGIETAEDLEQRDPQVYDLLTQKEFAFPSRAPDATYGN
jgi:hypothetical protein